MHANAASDRATRYVRGVKRIAAILMLMTGPAFAEKLQAPDGTIRDVPSASVEAARKQGYVDAPATHTIHMRSPDNDVVMVEPGGVTYFEGRGYWRMTEDEVRVWETERNQETGEGARRTGWLSDDARDLGAAACGLIGIGGIAWWYTRRRRR